MLNKRKKNIATMDTVLAVPRSKRWTFDEDPSDYGSTCEWIFDRFDDVWGAWTIGLFIAPLVLAFFMECCNVCRFSRFGYTLRLFLFSWVVWGCVIFNAWIVPRSCPGLAFLNYPLDAFIIIAMTLVSICLSWCEILIFCADRGVMGYKDEPSLRAADAQDALIILQNLIASNNTSPPENSENNSEVDVQIVYRGWCSVRHTELVGRHRPVTYRNNCRPSVDKTIEYIFFPIFLKLIFNIYSNKAIFFNLQNCFDKNKIITDRGPTFEFFHYQIFRHRTNRYEVRVSSRI